MVALVADRNTPQRDAVDFEFPAAAATRYFTGSIVCVNSSGYAVKGATATGLRAAGVCRVGVDNSAGLAGAMRVMVRRGCFRFANSSGADLVGLKDIGLSCYIVDDQTVALTSGSNTRSVAGVIRDVDANGVWVEF